MNCTSIGKFSLLTGMLRFSSDHPRLNISIVETPKSAFSTALTFVIFWMNVAVMLFLLRTAWACEEIRAAFGISFVTLPFLFLMIAPWLSVYSPGPEEDEQEVLEAAGQVQS